MLLLLLHSKQQLLVILALGFLYLACASWSSVHLFAFVSSMVCHYNIAHTFWDFNSSNATAAAPNHYNMTNAIQSNSRNNQTRNTEH